jgi:hypothetical protein
VPLGDTGAKIQITKGRMWLGYHSSLSDAGSGGNLQMTKASEFKTHLLTGLKFHNFGARYSFLNGIWGTVRN